MRKATLALPAVVVLTLVILILPWMLGGWPASWLVNLAAFTQVPGAPAEAAAAVRVAYALAATAERPPAEPDPFQTGDAARPTAEAAKDTCRCSGRSDCTCSPGRCECAACSDAWTPAAFEAARRGRLPVVICVGQPAIRAPGWLSYSTDDYANTPRPGILVARPDDGDLVVVTRRAGRPTPAEIDAILDPPPLAPVPVQPAYHVPVLPTWARPVFPSGGLMPARGSCRS